MQQVHGSFRDPYSGVVIHQNQVFRWMSSAYEPHYRQLMDSGLYDQLVKNNLIVSHQEVDIQLGEWPADFRIILPRQIPFISYPYEWSFAQYREAALVLLQIQQLAMSFGMSLRDASAYNFQFLDGRMVLIDTASFEILPKNQPWVAYGQFCRHFLAPLCLMAGRDIRLGGMMQQYIDGIPLSLAYRLLPLGQKLKPGLLMHLYFHGKSSGKTHANHSSRKPSFSMASFLGLIQSLTGTIRTLKVKKQISTWENYYRSLILSDEYLAGKKEIVAAWIQKIRPAYTWDLGANDGSLSRIAAAYGLTVAFDSDQVAVEWGYENMKNDTISQLLPLRLDLTNPSPGLGWASRERMAWLSRPLPELTLALALIHHLAIGNNVPMTEIARLFGSLSPWLIAEFVPRSDPKVIEMLAFREDIFSSYHPEGFEESFSRYFEILEKKAVAPTQRVLYLMKRK
ncbi:MAG: SAM-dependent methyltransferase [Bacteroidia bacterium]